MLNDSPVLWIGEIDFCNHFNRQIQCARADHGFQRLAQGLDLIKSGGFGSSTNQLTQTTGQNGQVVAQCITDQRH